MPTSQVVSLDSSWQGIKGRRGWIIGIGCMRHRITWLRRTEWLEICFYDGRGGLVFLCVFSNMMKDREKQE